MCLYPLLLQQSDSTTGDYVLALARALPEVLAGKGVLMRRPLYHLPFRYEDRQTRATSTNNRRDGVSHR